MPNPCPSAIGRNRTTRVTISLPAPVYQSLQHRSDLDGRSLSSLCAVLLEIACRSIT